MNTNKAPKFLKSNFPLKMTREERQKLEDYAWENRKSKSQVLRDLIKSL